MNVFFKKEFLEDILNGKKTQTIRTWSTCRLKKGDIFLINFRLKAEVVNVSQKYFNNITVDEIKKDGFQSVEDLKNWLIENNFSLNGKFWIIEFNLLSPKC